MAGVRTPAELDRLMDEVRDRYGPPPESVLSLAEYASIRLLADRLGIESLDREGQTVVLKFRPDARVDPTRLLRLVHDRGDLTLIPPVTVRLDLRQAPAPTKAPVRPPQPPPKAGVRAGAKKGGDPVAGGSWWAARARSGEVTSGFTRDEIMRPAKEDPRAEGGLFGRVGGFLRELSDGGSIS
jgi:transcription-repair coupling factor (superfamily II helicase)